MSEDWEEKKVLSLSFYAIEDYSLVRNRIDVHLTKEIHLVLHIVIATIGGMD